MNLVLLHIILLVFKMKGILHAILILKFLKAGIQGPKDRAGNRFPMEQIERFEWSLDFCLKG